MNAFSSDFECIEKLALSTAERRQMVVSQCVLPIIEKTTIPANIEVKQFVNETVIASRKQLLLTGLYDENAIKPPNASPRLKKICVPASNHTTGSFSMCHCKGKILDPGNSTEFVLYQRRLTFGVNKCHKPSDMPFRVMPRKKNMIRTI